MNAVETDDELGPVFRLVYRSRSTVEPGERRAELAAIYAVAGLRNAGLAVTGALLVWDHVFVQVLEGDEQVVRSLFRTIEADTRHTNVSLLDADTVPSRVFARWSMARVDDDGEADIPVLSDPLSSGPTVARTHPRSPGRDTMLGLMCDYARSG